MDEMRKQKNSCYNVRTDVLAVSLSESVSDSQRLLNSLLNRLCLKLIHWVLLTCLARRSLFKACLFICSPIKRNSHDFICSELA